MKIVAEISANHLGSLARARALIYEAKRSGADAVKLQTYTPRSMVADEAYVIPDGPWAGRYLFELYAQAQTPREWHPELFSLARTIGIELFSSAFSWMDIQVLEDVGCPRYKISSFELVDLPLIRDAARTGKPLILSTGMASVAEVDDAVDAALGAGCKDITLLKCTSGYPSPPREMNLAAIPWMRGRWGLPIGLSDHSLDPNVALVAAVLGAELLEVHLTLARADGGPDASFSYEPAEFKKLVDGCRVAATALGATQLEPTASEIPQRALRRSLWWMNSREAGQIALVTHIRTARPALGLPPAVLPLLDGKPLARDVRAGTPVLAEDFGPIPALPSPPPS